MYIDAGTERFETVTFRGKEMIFSCCRIDRETVPDGYFAYDVRDNCDGVPIQFGRFVLVNHWGTVITNEPLPLDDRGYLDIDPEEEWNYLGDRTTLAEYMARFPAIAADT